MIDTCEQYCTKVRHRLSRKDGKSSTEAARKSSDSGKSRRSKERRSEDSQSRSKDDGLKMPIEEKVKPKSRSRSLDKQEAQGSGRTISNSPDRKRLKCDDKHKSADVTDQSNAVAEISAIDGECLLWCVPWKFPLLAMH